MSALVPCLLVVIIGSGEACLLSTYQVSLCGNFSDIHWETTIMLSNRDLPAGFLLWLVAMPWVAWFRTVDYVWLGRPTREGLRWDVLFAPPPQIYSISCHWSAMKVPLMGFIDNSPLKELKLSAEDLSCVHTLIDLPHLYPGIPPPWSVQIVIL